MHAHSALFRLAVCAVSALVATSVAATGATILADSFEPSINGAWWIKGPSSWAGAQAHEELKGDNCWLRTPGINCARVWVNYRVTYNSQHALPMPYASGVYLKCWVSEGNDIPYPPVQHEGWPNGHITLLDTTSSGDSFMLGVMGYQGMIAQPVKPAYFYNCCVYTATDGYKPLDGTLGRPVVPRRQGSRKYTILVNGYTGQAGDVQFLIDDKLVYNGRRMSAPPTPPSPPLAGGDGGEVGAPVDTIVLGSKWWTYETYAFDDVEFGTIETPVDCNLISDANAQPDETWVTLTSKVVAGSFTYGGDQNYDRPFPGHVVIEEDDRSAALWVSSSYIADVRPATNEAERINVKGIMRTNEAGMRLLDAIEISHASGPVDQPRALGTALRSLGSPALDGKLVKVWGKVVNVPGSDPPAVKAQERPGDWRHYFMIDDGSTTSPSPPLPGGDVGGVKCYYGNIIVPKPGTDPTPAVTSGDFVSVVGVAGREVLVPGTTGPEKSVWIRGAGDLVILRPAP